jgi:O-acetyl-ADP-ribose deacetylase (regulator of RNase III)
MIELVTGNILKADAEALVNTVNCVGVMGKGIAFQFKQAFPGNFRAYKVACDAGKVRPEHMFVFETGWLINPKFIINFPTKRHWKGKSKLEDIESGLRDLISVVRKNRIASVAVPPLGCGYGGLRWAEVRPRVERAFSQLPEVRVLLYEPEGTPKPDTMPVATDVPRMTRARALLVKLIENYCLLGYYRLSMLEIQKLAYLLQGSGEPLRLQFVPHHYGPYADNLNFVLQRIEGHFIRGYGDGSRKPQTSLRLLDDAVRQADEFLADDAEGRQRLEAVKNLIEGFETPYGMELLATVHWVATQGESPAMNPEEAVDKTRQWSRRKRARFPTEHIAVAWERLAELRVVEPSEC